MTKIRKLPSFPFMRKGLSVKDLAERIGGTRPEAERARMVEQLRYWTRLNLLEPAGPKHGGSGRWRTYPGSAVYVAAVLNEISRFRVSVPVMERLAEAIRYGLEGGAKDGPEDGLAGPDARPATFFASRLLEELRGCAGKDQAGAGETQADDEEACRQHGTDWGELRRAV